MFGNLPEKASGSPWGWGWWQRRRQAQITCVVMLFFFFTSRDCFSPYRLCCCSQHPIGTCSGPGSHLSFSWLQPEVCERELMTVHNFSKLSWGRGGGVVVGGVLSLRGHCQWHWAHFVQVQSWSSWRRQWSAVVRTSVTSPLPCALSLFTWSSSV